MTETEAEPRVCPGVAHFDDDAAEVLRLAVLDGFEKRDGVVGVGLGVELFDGGAGEAFFVEVGGVFHLDFGGVHEHEGGDGGGGGGAVDGAAVALFDEVGEVSAVVDVAVGEDDEVDFFGVEVEAAVDFFGEGAGALEGEAAVQ